MIYLPQINSLSNITGYKIKVESLIDLMNPTIYSALEHLSRQCNLTIESSDLMDSVKLKAALKIILPERCLITVHASDIEACGVSLIEDINQKTRRLVYQEDASKEGKRSKKRSHSQRKTFWLHQFTRLWIEC